MLEKMKSYIEPNRTVRNIMIVVLCLLIGGVCGSFFIGFSRMHADFGDIHKAGTVEMERNFDEEDYDEESTVCDVTYENGDAYMVVSYSYEEYEQLEDDSITAYAYTTDNGETLYFDHADPTMEQAQAAYQAYMADEMMPVFNFGISLLILFLSVGTYQLQKDQRIRGGAKLRNG